MTDRTSKLVAPYPNTFTWRMLEWFCRGLELVFFPEFLMMLNRAFKPNTRILHNHEITLAKSVFGQSIDCQKVRIDDRSSIGCKKHHFAYVGFNFINSWGALSEAHFIHEMVHVWQYQKLGIVYIPRALYAQTTAEGYNYGGIATLQKARKEGKNLLDFNYEQQGDIVADYFRLRCHHVPIWCERNQAYLPDFEYFMEIFKKHPKYIKDEQ
jgi:hypothetical protein